MIEVGYTLVGAHCPDSLVLQKVVWALVSAAHRRPLGGHQTSLFSLTRNSATQEIAFLVSQSSRMSEEKLAKTLSLTDLVFFGIATILGSGGFNLIGEAVVHGGNWWPAALSISTLVFLGASRVYEEAFNTFKNNTAESDFVKKYLGTAASNGTVAAVLLWNILSIGTILVLCSHMLFPDGSWLGQVGFALFLLISMTLFSLKGLDVNKETVNLFSGALIAFLSVITGLGITGVAQKVGIAEVPSIPSTSFPMSILFFYFILAGFDALIKFTEETKDEKDIPKSFYISNIISSVLTLGMCLAFVSWVNIRKLTHYDNGLGDILQVFLGGNAKQWVMVGSVAYMIITTFVAYLATTRYIYGLAEQHSSLSMLRGLNENKVPTKTVALTTIASAATILINHIEKLVRLSSVSLSSMLILVSAAATKSMVEQGKLPLIEGLTTASFVGLMGLSIF